MFVQDRNSHNPHETYCFKSTTVYSCWIRCCIFSFTVWYAFINVCSLITISVGSARGRDTLEAIVTESVSTMMLRAENTLKSKQT